MCTLFFKITFVSKIAWIKCLQPFYLFSRGRYFVLFELSFWLRLLSLSSKSAYGTKFARVNLESKTCTESLLNSGVVIYFSWLWSVSLFFNFGNFYVIICFSFFFFFLTKLLILGILFPKSDFHAVSAAFVAKTLLDILFSTLVIFAL